MANNGVDDVTGVPHAFHRALDDQVKTARCPALVWDYAEESFTGEAVDLARSTHGLLSPIDGLRCFLF
eukprot:9311098-Pyramimonas_sp.AAC.1